MTRKVPILVAKLIALIGPFLLVIMLAVINGVIGYLLAINITVFAGLALLKFLGISMALSYQTIFIIIIVSGILRGVVRYFEQYSNHFIAFKILGILRGKIFNALRKLSPAMLEDKNKGDLVSLLQGDIETLEVFYAHTITPVLIALITSIILVVFLSITTSIYLGLIALFSYLVIGIMIPIIFYRKNAKFGQKYRQELGDFEDFYLDSIYAGYEIISQNQKDSYLDAMRKRSKKLINLTTNLENKNVLFSNITSILIVVLNALIILGGFWLVKKGLMSDAKIILAYVTLTSSFGPVLALANLPNNLAQTFASGNRVLDILALKNEQEYGTKDFSFQSLEFKDVAFSYSKKPVLDKLSFKISNKQIIGIFGPSGSGKSTILKLIMRFYDPQQGTILVNDLDVKNYSQKALYNNINLFSQSTYLFHDTILNNLLIAKPNATLEEVKIACQNAGIYDYIMSQKEGFATKIADLKNNISEGEKQRLGLARVFLRKPKLLLLDEATANIDAINEGIILKALASYRDDMSIVIISHRMSTLSICDQIYEFKENKLCLV